MSMTILCPTDFSPTAAAACQLALRIAAERGYRVHILHAYSLFHSAFQGESNNKADQERARHEAQRAMDDFVQSLELNLGKAKVTSSLSDMNLTKAINIYAENIPLALVVMGTEGAKGVAGSLTGSNSYHLAKDTSVPVLIIPEGCAAKELNRAVFFTDYQPNDKLTLNTMKQVFGTQAAGNCTLIHITTNEDPAEVAREEKKIFDWKLKLEDVTGISGLKAMVTVGTEHITTVNQVLSRSGADLALITVVGGRSFFERLTKKSLARAIILNSETPILLTHQE